MTTFNETYDKTTPAGTDAPSVIDDRIQENKKAVQERENVDHYWPYASAADVAGGNEVASKYSGEHRKITFYGNITDPTQVAGKGHLYMKGGDFYYQDATNPARKLTLAGAINIISADLLGKLANNTYFTAVDAAGTGTVDLIKANDSDVAVLPDGSQLATSDPPTEDAGIVNKKYFDDRVPDDDAFGTWAIKSSNTVYQAESDGFVCAFKVGTGTGGIAGYTDGSNPPTLVKARNSSTNLAEGGMGITFPVKKSDYWKVTGATAVNWLPIGG